ncbi:hypothetical protein VNI00_009682 [Paramarasmius palmivorus]|uniref:Aminoglycoside phosphotransferase domain-containing protein n=1 Tax=Paramarasmius palmivorus TaxID=297713 RepID=A0AAW0CQA2_9AGAR
MNTINPQHEHQFSWLKAPTENEIARVVLAERAGMSELSFSSRVVNLHDGRFVKRSYRKELVFTEAMAMEFIRTHTTIPVPRVHMVFVHEDCAYIVMDTIPGQTLQNAASDFSPEACQNYAKQLRAIVDELGSLSHKLQSDVGISSPELCPIDSGRKNFYGQWPDKSFADNKLFGFKQTIPTFSSINELLSHILPPGEVLELPLDDASTRPVLTHSDLASQNIMVDTEGNILGILDWEMFGWYPAFWERMIVLGRACTRSPKIFDALEGTFGTFELEMERLSEIVVGLAGPMWID